MKAHTPAGGGKPLLATNDTQKPLTVNGLQATGRPDTAPVGGLQQKPAKDVFAIVRELLDDGSERVTLPWSDESILIEALGRRIERGLIEVDREYLPDGSVRITYRNLLP